MYLCTKKWVSVLHSYHLNRVKQKKENKTGSEIKWIPEDTEYKNIIIFHGLSNRVAQKALGSC